MPVQHLLDQIEASFAEERLTDADRRLFIEMLRNSHPSEEGLRQLRNAAFGQVRALLQTPEQMGVLKWLEGIVRSLDVAREPVAALHSEAHFSPGNGCRDAVLYRLRQAQRSADICVFTISDDEISAAILAAHSRGIAVRVISDDDKALDAGSDVFSLRRQGVPLIFDDSPAHMHHKFAVIDGSWLLNGSYNWTRTASTVNEENLTVTNDAALVAAFAERFALLWQRWAA
ncbi:Phospholipase D [Andreprevotia sp. IGB-42]|uniref:phospholipase D-like domain-containing protein n=1 Tax=Andreprevotia sp. IGB-42 TaxID=2497473 RepID=UPI00135AB8E3|nr:phospholipase D-like domain-containing protein [Andreprevotia sp. IGB-42]KAF0814920.1 Phospholipase D [Andreprevotia sp. IGB-42]